MRTQTGPVSATGKPGGVATVPAPSSRRSGAGIVECCGAVLHAGRCITRPCGPMSPIAADSTGLPQGASVC